MLRNTIRRRVLKKKIIRLLFFAPIASTYGMCVMSEASRKSRERTTSEAHSYMQAMKRDVKSERKSFRLQGYNNTCIKSKHRHRSMFAMSGRFSPFFLSLFHHTRLLLVCPNLPVGYLRYGPPPFLFSSVCPLASFDSIDRRL
jgi:hypothetical protein